MSGIISPDDAQASKKNKLIFEQDGSCESSSKLSKNQDDDEDGDNECWDDAKQDPSENEPHFHDSCHAPPDHATSSPCPQSSSQVMSTTTSATSHIITNSNNPLFLHEAIFNEDTSYIISMLDSDEVLVKQYINHKDKHGNTPLHLACMLGRPVEVVSRLLAAGASIDIKNLQRWTPISEACSYGNRDIIRLLSRQLNDDLNNLLNKQKFSENLEKTRDYRLVLKWEFQSWLPFVARVLPSDTCTITKQGKFIRIDTRLLDVDTFWKRGDCSLIYSHKFIKKWVLMNNSVKKYQFFETPSYDSDIESKVNGLMMLDIMDFELKSSEAELTRSTSGWLWKVDKIEKVGNYNAAIYNFNNVLLITRKRREHLSLNDLKRNKLAYKLVVDAFKYGIKPDVSELEGKVNKQYGNSSDDNQSENWSYDPDSYPEYRPSLEPPPKTKVTWTEYCKAKPGEFPTLGREQKLKVVKTSLKASVGMSEEFPMSKSDFSELLSAIPLKHFKKLREFIEMKLPNGFPIRVDIPILPVLSARITFQDFTFLDKNLDKSLFDIPSNYVEDPNLFPRFSQRPK